MQATITPHAASHSVSPDGAAPKVPRTRGRMPSQAELLRFAAGLTEESAAGAARALRAHGLGANQVTIAAALAEAKRIKERRRLRHWQNAAKRLGHAPSPTYMRWPDSRTTEPSSPSIRLQTLRVRAVEQTAKGLFRHGAAGGDSMTVTFARLSSDVGYRAEMETNRNTYRGAFKGWAANEDHHRICVPKDWRRRVLARGLADLGGLMTLDAHPLDVSGGAELFAATWAAQGRGYAVHVHRGYIARIGLEHFHADTVDGALAGVQRRARATFRVAPLELTVAAFVKRYRGIEATVTLSDAHRSGSCDYGIRSWCAAVGLDYD